VPRNNIPVLNPKRSANASNCWRLGWVIAKFVAHRHKEVQNKAKKVVGIVNLYEVQFADMPNSCAWL